MVQIKYWYRVIKKKTNYLQSGASVYFSFETQDGVVYALTPTQAADIIEDRICKTKYDVILDSITIKLGSSEGDTVLRTMAPMCGVAKATGKLTRILEKEAFKTPVLSARQPPIRQFPANDRWEDDEIPIYKYLTVIHRRTTYPILKQDNFK